MKNIDACCNKAGLYPDALLCGHAHLYQRFTRVMKSGKEVPYIVAGSGGYAATAPKQLPAAPITVGDHTLEITPIVDFGYLAIETDAQTMSIEFKTCDGRGVATRDSVVLDLKAGKIMLPGQPVLAARVSAGISGKRKPPRVPKKTKKRVGDRKTKS